jgi:hypothetical protein
MRMMHNGLHDFWLGGGFIAGHAIMANGRGPIGGKHIRMVVQARFGRS